MIKTRLHLAYETNGLIVIQRLARIMTSKARTCVIRHRFTAIVTLLWALGGRSAVPIDGVRWSTLFLFLGTIIAGIVQLCKVLIANLFPCDILPTEAACIEF